MDFVSPSLLAQFVAAAEYPSTEESISALKSLYPILERANRKYQLLTVSFRDDDQRDFVAVISLFLIPESIEQEIITALSLPPGKLTELHSDVVSILVMCQLNSPTFDNGQKDIVSSSMRKLSEYGDVIGEDSTIWL